jgi:hypothetical protein
MVKGIPFSGANGTRIVIIALTKYILSYVTTAGKRVLASYEGQPMTSNGSGEPGHLYQIFPKRRRLGIAATKEPTASKGKGRRQHNKTKRGPRRREACGGGK